MIDEGKQLAAKLSLYKYILSETFVEGDGEIF